MNLFTIGHSNLDLQTWLARLREFSVDAVGDVRSAPHSARFPHFNRDVLKATLERSGIAYRSFGRPLGGRTEDPSLLTGDGRVDYEAVARLSSLKKGLDELLNVDRRLSIALLCSEGEPIACHRSLLVARAAASRCDDIKHIHRDGRIESHKELEARLLRMAGLGNRDLFRTDDEVLDQAYRDQAAKVAYAARQYSDEMVPLA